MTMDHHHAEHHPAGDPAHGAGYETRDVAAGTLVVAGAILLVIIVVVQLVLLGVYRVIERDREPEPALNVRDDLYDQLRRLRKSEEETLTTYGWVDRKAGVVRIPIERAMQLVAERGVPKGKGPKTQVEINAHHGTHVKAKDEPKAKEAKP
jgi:hypothetical protein